MSSNVTINGKNVAIPKNFFDVGVKASFNENTQAALTTEEFTFVLDAYEEIISWIEKGIAGGVGIFEGIPLSITNSDEVNNVSIFNGIIDLQAGHEIQEELRQIKAAIRQDDSMNQLDELIEPLDFGYLASLGVITNSDYVNVDYVVNKTDKGLETIATFVTIYLLSKQLADTVKELGETIAIVSGIGVSGATGPIGAAVYAVAVAILQVAYAATLLILIIDFGKDLLNILVQPTRTHKGIPLKTLIERTCEHIGFELNTTITDLDKLVYLPSNNAVDQYGLKGVLKTAGSVTEGIPGPGDVGYRCTDLFELASNLFNGRFAIRGGVVQFHGKNSDYWVLNSSWVKPNVYSNPAQRAYRYNTDELNSSILLQFETDVRDEYTIKNYRGTAYQVLTDAKAVNVPKNKIIKGVDPVRFPIALGSRKNELNPFEKALFPLANIFDRIGGVFGGRPNLAKKIKSKIGVLEVSNNNHSIPKLLWMEGGRLPSNHRDLFSAKTLYDKYHVEKSFVANDFSRQRKYIEREQIPFRLSDFVSLLDNSYFSDEDGKRGKMVEIEWNFSKDYATVSYWLQETYTTNLKETKIEPA